MAKSKNFQFHGGASSYLGVGILSALLTIFTFGIATPWAICMQQRWKINNTTIGGRKLQFNGSGIGLFGLWIKWLIFIFITFGIYSLWVGPRIQQWVVENTDFVE